MPQSTYTVPDPTRSVLLTIDMQRDFSSPDAPAYVDGTEAVVPRVRRVLDAFRSHQRPIVHVVRLYRPDGSNVDVCRRRDVEEGKRVVTPDTEGAELVEELTPTPDTRLDPDTLLSGGLQPLAESEWALYKPRWGAFYQTPLNDFLHRHDLNTVVVVGCNFPNCPRTTIYEASERDFRIVAIPEAVSGTYQRGLQELKNIGVHLMTAKECDDWLTREQPPVPPAASINTV